MWRVKDRNAVPQNGYSFVEPATGTEFRDRSLGRLYHLVKDHRLANNIPLGESVYAEIEQAWCKDHPEYCIEVNAEGGPSLAQMGGNFIRAMAQWADSGFKMVDRETFDRRKDLCTKCTHFREWRDSGMAKCKLCGCPNGKITLKLWMATEKCPDKPPRW